MNRPEIITFEDVQNTPDIRKIAINKVGIRSIKHPVKIRDKNTNLQHTIATFNMYVHLPQHLKGTHMSRFIEILNLNEEEFSIKTLAKVLYKMISRLNVNAGYIEASFPFFINKTAPVSGVKSLLDYEVTFIGEIKGGHYNQIIKLLVPVTSLCPCSKKISAYGAHNQRSHITVTARIKDHLYIEDLLKTIEQQASSELYGLLKRPDEKYVTEQAYDNPKFVEDLVRDVATALNTDKRIDAYTVECENFESIHNHSAYALIEHGDLFEST
jgi:GTP cyclohydrolase I